jgi:hypothetical protein
MGTDGAAWFTPEEIAFLEGTTERWTRAKYIKLAEQQDPSARLWIRWMDGPGGRHCEFPFELLEPGTKAKILNLPDLKSEISHPGTEGLALPGQPLQEEQEKANFHADAVLPSKHSELSNLKRPAISPAAALTASPSPSETQLSVFSSQLSERPKNRKSQTVSVAVSASSPATIELAATQRLFGFADRGKKRVETRFLPEAKAPLAYAREAAIRSLLSGTWKRYQRAQESLYGIIIRTKEDFLAALARDSQEELGALEDWRTINEELRTESKDARASLTPVSSRSLERWCEWYRKGRPRLVCADGDCRGDVDQKTSLCRLCGMVQRLPVGIVALQKLDRTDKGRIHLLPDHAEYLTAAYSSGDETVTRKSLAFERPRSARECLELLELEIANERIPGPAPSVDVLRRWIREALPQAVKDYTRNGRKRALAHSGPHLVRAHEHLQVNDQRLWDFRAINVRTWFDADGSLFRLWLCCGLDTASRDVIFCFDLHPSAGLFKSTWRAFVLRWGVAQHEWMDNGKEFKCKDVLGRETREWFELDTEMESMFRHVGSDPHFCLRENPNGKALLERFFQNFDAIERKLPGWTGERSAPGKVAFGRPERLKYEERLHEIFSRGERPDTPLLHIVQETTFDGQRRPGLIPFLTDWIRFCYRHRKHSGDGMHLRTPAQLQEAFPGVRRVPRIEELDLLLWHRAEVLARGDTVSCQFQGVTYTFRNRDLLALPGEPRVELHMDPHNVDRAVAMPCAGGEPIVLEPAKPTGERSAAEITHDVREQRAEQKALRNAALLSSRLRPIPGPSQLLSMLQKDAARKQAALDASSQQRREEFSMPGYGDAVAALENRKPKTENRKPEERVFTSKTEYEQWKLSLKP